MPGAREIKKNGGCLKKRLSQKKSGGCFELQCCARQQLKFGPGLNGDCAKAFHGQIFGTSEARQLAFWGLQLVKFFIGRIDR